MTKVLSIIKYNKLLANSTYGQVAIGLNIRTLFDIRTGLTRKTEHGMLTNPALWVCSTSNHRFYWSCFKKQIAAGSLLVTDDKCGGERQDYSRLYSFARHSKDRNEQGRSQMTIGVVSLGMLLLALWLILTGLSSFIRLKIPSQAMGVLAVLAGILLLVGR